MVQFHAKESEKNLFPNKNYMTDENQLLGDHHKDFLINRDDYMIVKVNNILTKQLIKMLSNLRKQCKIDFWHIKRTLTISTLFQFGARLSTGKKTLC